MPPEAPPGRYPLSRWPGSIPPQCSSINSRAVMPVGAILTPGRATRPDTE